MVPEPTEVAAGTVTFTVVNDGEMEHEMVVVKTDKGAANLGTENGEAERRERSTRSCSARASRERCRRPGGGRVRTCLHLPGHYAAGMYADFTVT